MKKHTFLLSFSIFFAAFCLPAIKGYSQCPDMSHPISKEDVTKYQKNYGVLITLHGKFAMRQINVTKEEMECLLKTTDKIKFMAASYSAFNGKTLVAIVELHTQGNTYYYDLDELFQGKKHMSYNR